MTRLRNLIQRLVKQLIIRHNGIPRDHPRPPSHRPRPLDPLIRQLLHHHGIGPRQHRRRRLRDLKLDRTRVELNLVRPELLEADVLVGLDDFAGDFGPEVAVLADDVDDGLVGGLDGAVDFYYPEQVAEVAFGLELFEFLVDDAAGGTADDVHLAENIEFVLIIEFLLIHKQMQIRPLNQGMRNITILMLKQQLQ